MVLMQSYQQSYRYLTAKMKEQTPSNWVPAVRMSERRRSENVKHYGTGLTTEIKMVKESDPPPVNKTMYQAFEWYTPSWSTPITTVDATRGMVFLPKTAVQPFELPPHYAVVESMVPHLADLGVTTIWLPPGCKATNPEDNGYGVYDLYDLGEFEQKGSRSTKWGSKEELISLGKKAEECGVGLLWDALLNHRAAADGKENIKAIACVQENRTIENPSVRDIVAWTRFDYAARAGKYSDMTYNWRHFSGIDWDDQVQQVEVLKFLGDEQTQKPGWATDVDDELGNFDYLMFADVDYSQPDVKADVMNWSTWIADQIPGLQGMRIDAVKHFSAAFSYEFLKNLRQNEKTKDWFFVGEYWKGDSKFLSSYIDGFAGHMHLYDVKLVYNLSEFSQGKQTDLRDIFKDTLVAIRPEHAVTFVSNHDTQRVDACNAIVDPWFIPHAYALVLLRAGGTPCIFHGDVFGTQGPEPFPPACGHKLMRLSKIRTMYSYGPQHDFFMWEDCVGWTREGHAAHNDGAGLAVVLNASWRWRRIKMFVGRKHRGETWKELMGWSWDQPTIDEKGWAYFRVAPRSIGVWTDKKALQRETVDKLLWPPVPGMADGASSSGYSSGSDSAVSTP